MYCNLRNGVDRSSRDNRRHLFYFDRHYTRIGLPDIFQCNGHYCNLRFPASELHTPGSKHRNYHYRRPGLRNCRLRLVRSPRIRCWFRLCRSRCSHRRKSFRHHSALGTLVHRRHNAAGLCSDCRTRIHLAFCSSKRLSLDRRTCSCNSFRIESRCHLQARCIGQFHLR